LKIASTQYSVANNSFEIYLSGCSGSPKCNGCHNNELWDFSIGTNVNDEFLYKITEKIKRFESIIDNIFILGGEPLDQNKKEFVKMIEILLLSKKKMWLFTRFEIDEIDTDILLYFNYIKCGRYYDNLLCDDNFQYGIKLSTSNQKMYKKGIDY